MASHLKPPLGITLYRGFQGSGNYVWSPFVTKLETRLRFAGLAYRTEAGSLSKAPKGKIPYVTISSKTDSTSPTPVVLADSTLITERLVKDGVSEDLNAKLSPTEKALDVAIRALLEDKLCFYQVGSSPSCQCCTTLPARWLGSIHQLSSVHLPHKETLAVD